MGTPASTNLAPRDETFAKGEILLREGEPSGDLWIIRQGKVEVFRERQGRRFTLATIEAGEMLGTMTAATGAPRSASVQALTAVVVTIIPKDQVQKLMKGLPGWALALVRDLVGRVNYANSLYIDRETSNPVAEESSMHFVWQLTKGLSVTADSLALQRNGRKVMAVDKGAVALADSLGTPEDASKVIDILVQHGIVDVVDNDGDGRLIDATAALELTLFADLLGNTIRQQEAEGAFVVPLALGERRFLQELAAFGRASADEGDRITLSLADVQDALRRRGLEFAMETLLSAQKLGLLDLDKAATPPSLTFDPGWVEFTLRSFNAMRDLAALGLGKTASAVKKTLLY